MTTPDIEKLCKCYRYEPDEETRRADIMTGGSGEGWTVTADCPIHHKQPDIEKLRGLPEKWRYYKDGTKQGRDASETVSQRCARELEAAGLPELLRDYERLLAKENGAKP